LETSLKFDISIVSGYRSSSQIARVLTEAWVKQNIYCPSCGNDVLKQFDNNSPVADFLCNSCTSEYELKSKKNSFSLRIVDGAYNSMIERINSENNPNFFFMNYSFQNLEVINFLVIPKHFFVNDIIEKRKPLSVTARRAGWIGCNILLKNIPATGKIFLVKDGKFEERKTVLEKWSRTAFLANQKQENRGWTIEVLKAIEKIPCSDFSLNDIYKFEAYFQEKFPKNNFIKDKLRQQLQILRDKGLVEFKGKGLYRKIA
jgi:type II restriction enzyme